MSLGNIMLLSLTTTFVTGYCLCILGRDGSVHILRSLHQFQAVSLPVMRLNLSLAELFLLWQLLCDFDLFLQAFMFPCSPVKSALVLLHSLLAHPQ